MDRQTIHLDEDATTMDNHLFLPPITAEVTICRSADLFWDSEDAESFRDLCRSAFGRDCLCEEGQQCPLIPASGQILPWPRAQGL